MCIDNLIKNFKTTKVIMILFIKNFCVTSFAIIESLIYCVIKEKNLEIKKQNLEIKKRISNDTKIDNKNVIIETILYEKKPGKKEIIMDFVDMVNILEGKKILENLGDKKIYKELRNFSKLRNNIHLHIEKADKINTDWHNFFFKELNNSKKLLYKILNFYFKLTEKEQKYFKFLN